MPKATKFGTTAKIPLFNLCPHLSALPSYTKRPSTPMRTYVKNSSQDPLLLHFFFPRWLSGANQFISQHLLRKIMGRITCHRVQCLLSPNHHWSRGSPGGICVFSLVSPLPQVGASGNARMTEVNLTALMPCLRQV